MFCMQPVSGEEGEVGMLDRRMLACWAVMFLVVLVFLCAVMAFEGGCGNCNEWGTPFPTLNPWVFE